MFYFDGIGFGEIAPAPVQPLQSEPSNDTATNPADPVITGASTVATVTAQRSRTPTPSLETKASGSVSATSLQESNQPSPNVTSSEPTPLPLVGQSQPPANNNSVQTPKNENQAKGKPSESKTAFLILFNLLILNLISIDTWPTSCFNGKNTKETTKRRH